MAMDSPSGSSGRKRRKLGLPSRRKSNSSTSSDILVAPPPPPTSSEGVGLLTMDGAPDTMSHRMEDEITTARVDGGRMLVVSWSGELAREVFEELVDNDIKRSDPDSALGPDGITNDDGPNHRGTYSKAYVRAHPEIKWIHRGQGRYLPATQARSLETVSSSARDPGSRERRQHVGASTPGRTGAFPSEVPAYTGRSERRRALEGSKAKTPAVHETFGRSSLRRQKSVNDSSPNITNLLTTRSGRTTRTEPDVESPERRSSRFSLRHTYAEKDGGETEDDMAGDRDQTFDRQYVNAHPSEDFYHTGNGWYKKGKRPKSQKNAKRRESAGHPTARTSTGAYNFDANQTIHGSQLHLYPDLEFHHCGNGWFKPGPDSTGHRNSTIIERPSTERPSLEEDDMSEEDNILEKSVSREYTAQHPEIEWQHRGNGRYKAKPSRNNRRSGAEMSASVQPAVEHVRVSRNDVKTYSKQYVLSHPNEVFHHRGNARYMKGPPPASWAAGRDRRRSALNDAPATPEEDDTGLYTKEYVEAHPHILFHHRGQGRYARGPRQKPSTSMTRYDEPSDSEEDEEELLFDTDFVSAHPHETFHHRGQGRWARGLPPLGASNKVAVRGPLATQRQSTTTSQDEEDEKDPPPDPSALVLKSEGPARFPNLTWHYRGGGKWCRQTKDEASSGHWRETKKPRRTVKKTVDGATAQLEREAANADAAPYGVDGDGFAIPAEEFAPVKAARPQPRRRRTNNRDYLQSTEDQPLLSKKSSTQSVSQAPVPKPPVMTLEEDVLAEEDLPQLYMDEWSPPAEELDEADLLLRERFQPLNAPDAFVKSMTKFDPATRPTENLLALAANAEAAMEEMAQEYLELEKLTSQHRRVPGKPAKGGTVPIDALTWEDKKEADLYDYHFDARKIGEQDPDAQKIQRDADGRELRGGRRNRSAFQSGTLPGWNFGDEQPLGSRRAVKPPQRFDGIAAPPRKRMRNSTNTTSQAPSLTPERGYTPLTEQFPLSVPGMASAPGRWANHVPTSKRVQELRGGSVAAAPPLPPSKEGSPMRKGRPPGSKNLHKRKDAGIKKGPRRPKVDGEAGILQVDGAVSTDAEGDEDGGSGEEAEGV